MITGKKILLVDDEPDIIKTTGLALSVRGFKVITASCAEDALIRIKEERPDLIILDWMLPKMNGVELAVSVKNDGLKHIPVILITALLYKNEEELIRTRIIDCCFKKPFDLDQIIEKVGQLLKE